MHGMIGRGAMGEVWRAHDEKLGRPVALKVLLAQEHDTTATARFRLEARTAGRLSHPHVVAVLDFGEHEGRLFLVMELVEGGSLAQLLAVSGPLPAPRVAGIAAQAAAGLAAAHRQGIVHRDIKPANLLLDADGTVKIGDFGIARFLDDPAAALTATGQILGTGLYLAPERARGGPAQAASDVYALGCVLYQLLTQRPPFQADTALALLHQHLDTVPAPPRQLGIDVPSALEDYLLGMLAKQPDDRPTAQEVVNWLRSGAWRGDAQPLPPEAPCPTRPPGHTAAHLPSPAETVATASHTARDMTVPAQSTQRNAAAHRAPARRPDPAGSRRGSTRRPRAMVVLGGAALSVSVLSAAVSWLASGAGSAQSTQSEPSVTVSPSASSASPQASPRQEAASPSSDTPGTSSAPSRFSGVDSGAGTSRSVPVERKTKKSEKKAKKTGKGKH